ncbi:hypothetical protein D3C86_1647120 [compost metagenome]
MVLQDIRMRRHGAFRFPVKCDSSHRINTLDAVLELGDSADILRATGAAPLPPLCIRVRRIRCSDRKVRPLIFIDELFVDLLDFFKTTVPALQRRFDIILYASHPFRYILSA